MNNLLPISISPLDFFNSLWIIPGTLGSILGDPIVCYLAYTLSPKTTDPIPNSGSNQRTEPRVKWPILLLILQIVFGVIRTILMFCLVFWARFYCLENNVAGLFDGFINENDDADEDEINQRIYKNCAMAAFGFIKLHFFMMNFAVSFINNAAAHSKTGAFPNPFQKENNATIASSPISFNFNLLFHAAVVVLYVYIVFIFVWSVVGIKYAFLIGAVHVAIIIALYRNTIKYVLSLASGTSSTPQQVSQASSEGENKKND